MLVLSSGFVVGMALWLSTAPAYAQIDPGLAYMNNFNQFMNLSTGAAKHTVSIGSNGVPLVTSGVPGANAVGNMNFAHEAAGKLQARAAGELPTPVTGQKLGFTAGRFPIEPVSIGRALWNFTGKVVLPLTVGMAIFDLISDLGYMNVYENGKNVIKKPGLSTALCTGTPPTQPTIQDTYPSPSFTNQQAFVCYFDAGPQAYYWAHRATRVSTGAQVVSPLQQTGGSQSGGPPVLVTEAEFIDKIATQSGWPTGSKAGPALADAVKAGEGVKIEHGTATVVVPTAPIVGPTTTTVTTTNNTNTTTTENKTWNITNTVTNIGPTITYTETAKVTKTTPDGVTTTTTVDKPVDEKVITCGLPDTPKCKIDETGTPPDKGSTFTKTETDLDTQKAADIAEIAKAALIPAPAWSFSFALPTGCSSYATGIKNIVISVCSFQSTFHDLMSMIWAAVTAFAMMGMVGRTIREA